MSNSETDIIKIFIKESEMVNNRKLQLMYLMISIRISGVFLELSEEHPMLSQHL